MKIELGKGMVYFIPLPERLIDVDITLAKMVDLSGWNYVVDRLISYLQDNPRLWERLRQLATM